MSANVEIIFLAVFLFVLVGWALREIGGVMSSEEFKRDMERLREQRRARKAARR